MKKLLIFLLCIFVSVQVELFARSSGSHSSSHSSSRSSSRSSGHSSSSGKIGSSSHSTNVRSSSKNSSKINTGGSKGIRSFSKSTSSSPKSITKYVGKPFAKSKTINTSHNMYRRASYTYTRPVRFHNPYMTYYLLSNHHYYDHNRDSMRVDTTAFPGFGKGKSGGGGASATFKDSIKNHASKDTLEISELQPINYLSDYAGIIPDKDEPKINYLIRHYKKVTGVEMAVLTIPTLGDEIDLEDYAQVLFDKWGVGEENVNNGILIIISSEDEILRVQPGYGLEELLPDAICRRIEDEIMIPLCLKDEWGPAITGAINDITHRLGNKTMDIMKQELADRKKKEHQEMMNTLYTCLEVLAGLALVILIWKLVRRRGRREVW